MNEPRRRRKQSRIGNELDSGRGRTLDLRNLEAIGRRTLTPQINVTPARDELTAAPSDWALNGVAYDLLSIVVLGFIAIGTSYRDWAFLGYLILVLTLRIPSQRVFRSALLSLVLVPIVLSLHRENLGQEFAIFAFYFMAIGVIRAIIELRKAS